MRYCLSSQIPAVLDDLVVLVEGGTVRGPQHLLFELTVVADHPIKGLHRDVPAEELIQHTHALHVVIEPPARMGMEGGVQETLPRMSERRVPDIMP